MGAPTCVCVRAPAGPRREAVLVITVMMIAARDLGAPP